MPAPTDVQVTSSGTTTIHTLPAVGQTVSAFSLPVVVASDQTAIPVSALALPLPFGAATAANQPALNGDGGALTHVTNFPAMQSVTGTVTANAGTNMSTALLALDTSVNGILTAQGSTTYGQRGPLLQGAVTASAPSYISGQTNPLSLDTAGNLRVNVVTGGNGGGGSNFGAAFPAAGTAIGAKNGSNMVNLAADTNSNLLVSASHQVQSASVTPVISTTAYTTNYEAGPLMSFTGLPADGTLMSIVATCKSVQSIGLKLYLFNANPSHTTWTDKTAPAINALDIGFLIGTYVLGAPDSGLGTVSLLILDNIWKAYTIPSGTTLYGILTVQGAPTFASTSDLTVSVSVIG